MRNGIPPLACRRRGSCQAIMNFAFGFLIGQLMRWIVSKLKPLWWIAVGLIGGSVVGQLLGKVGVPQSIVIPVSWITSAFLMVYLRKRIKEKKAQMPSVSWENRG